MITHVVETDASFDRTAYLILKDNKVIFDDSNGEYGPIEFDLEILEKAIIKHKQNL